jgi:hypothetical protein
VDEQYDGGHKACKALETKVGLDFEGFMGLSMVYYVIYAYRIKGWKPFTA